MTLPSFLYKFFHYLHLIVLYLKRIQIIIIETLRSKYIFMNEDDILFTLNLLILFG